MAGQVLIVHFHMAGAATSIPEKNHAPQRAGAVWYQIVIAAAIILYLYAGVIVEMAGEWWTTPSQSQGLLIAPLALYVAWLRRRRLFNEPAVPDGRGLWLIALGCFLFLGGKLAAEYYVTRLSLVVLLLGCTWTFWGLIRVRTLALSFLLLVTMIPMPALVFNLLSTPLQLLASRIATEIAQMVGVSVYRDGNIIHLAGISLGVEEACSGLHSLSALFVGGILLGYLNCSGMLARAAVVLSSTPIAIAMNVVRVTGTAILADSREEFAMGFYHAFSGWLVFLGGFFLLYAFSMAIHHVFDRHLKVAAA